MAAGLLLGGCAGSLRPERAGDPAWHSGPVELRQVPFFAQQDHHCGPAALATLLSAAGKPASPEALAPEVYLPGRKGSLQVELMAAARRRGRIPYVLSPGPEALLRELAAGRPVMVLQDLGLPWFPVWHYAVVVGFDPAGRRVILRSGRRKRHIVGVRGFERTWRRAGRWALVVAAPGDVPQTARESDYFAAVAPLERLHLWSEAQEAYGAGLRRWPGNLVGLLGFANSVHARGERRRAARLLRRAVDAHPDAAPAHNNLAHVLMELGATQAALAAARRAVALGGDTHPEYRETLAAVQSRLARSAPGAARPR